MIYHGYWLLREAYYRYKRLSAECFYVCSMGRAPSTLWWNRKVPR